MYKHKLLCLRDQKALTPEKHKEFCQRFDPSCSGRDGVPDGFVVPCAGGVEAVRLVGAGTFPLSHFGNTEKLTLKAGSHIGYHKEALTEEEMRGGVLEVPAVALRRAVLWEGFGEGDGALGSYSPEERAEAQSAMGRWEWDGDGGYPGGDGIR